MADAEQDDIKRVAIEGRESYIGLSFKDSPTVSSIESILSENPDITEQISKSTGKKEKK
jgi:hypothetical protein